MTAHGNPTYEPIRIERKRKTLEFLLSGPKTTEEIRRVLCEDKPVAYNVIKMLQADGLVQAGGDQAHRRWRIFPSKLEEAKEFLSLHSGTI